VDFLNIAMPDVFNPAAACADQVVVLGEVREFVVGMVVPQINLGNDTSLS
jgi:hypothetical protein